MFFFRHAAPTVSLPEKKHTYTQPLLPRCYDTFRGTKIYNIIEHPAPEGDRVYMCVPYACCAAAKDLGARWDPEAKRWWHWSGSTQQLAHDDDTERWLEVLADVHAQSVFGRWRMDVDFMRHAKSRTLGLDDIFDYVNPRL
jgi:hypothetical protein